MVKMRDAWSRSCVVFVICTEQAVAVEELVYKGRDCACIPVAQCLVVGARSGAGAWETTAEGKFAGRCAAGTIDSVVVACELPGLPFEGS